MTRNDLTNLLLNAVIMVSIVLAVALYAYHDWQPVDPGPPEMQVAGPVDPVPRVEDHVAAVMKFPSSPGISHGQIRAGWISHEIQDGDCTQLKDGIIKKIPCCPDCPTWDTLKRAGLEVICTDAFGEVPSVSYWPVEVGMACSKIKKVVITDKRIEVERR